SRRVSQPIDGAPLAIVGDTSGAESALQDARAVLDEELHGLPEKYRLAVVLCCLEGKTNAEAARQLHWPLGTLQIRLLRAREVLRQRLTQRGIALSAGGLVCLLTQEVTSFPAALVQATAQAVMSATCGQGLAAGAGASQGILAKAASGGFSAAKVKVAALALVGAIGVSAALLPSRGTRWQAETTIPI